MKIVYYAYLLLSTPEALAYQIDLIGCMSLSLSGLLINNNNFSGPMNDLNLKLYV